MSKRPKLGMLNPNEEELAKIIDTFATKSFTNEYGEKFTIHSNGICVFMSGDEVNMMVPANSKINKKYINLFNDRFNIWSADELYQLGKALMELHK